LEEPVQAQITGHSRRPSVASRLGKAISSRLPSPTRSPSLNKRADVERQSPSIIAQPITTEPSMFGFSDPPQNEDTFTGFDMPEDNKSSKQSSKRHTKGSNSFSFVQQPLDGTAELEAEPVIVETPAADPPVPAEGEAGGDVMNDLDALLGDEQPQEDADNDWALPAKKGKKKGGKAAEDDKGDDDNGKKGKKGGKKAGKKK